MSEHHFTTKSKRYGHVYVVVGWDPSGFCFLQIFQGSHNNMDNIIHDSSRSDKPKSQNIDSLVTRLQRDEIELPDEMIKEVRLEKAGVLSALDKHIVHGLDEQGTHHRMDKNADSEEQGKTDIAVYVKASVIPGKRTPGVRFASFYANPRFMQDLLTWSSNSNAKGVSYPYEVKEWFNVGDIEPLGQKLLVRTNFFSFGAFISKNGGEVLTEQISIPNLKLAIACASLSGEALYFGVKREKVQACISNA